MSNQEVGVVSARGFPGEPRRQKNHAKRKGDGAVVLKYRLDHGLTQVRMGELADVTRSTVITWEQCTTINPKTKRMLARTFGIFLASLQRKH